jgi:hypothetical protein
LTEEVAGGGEGAIVATDGLPRAQAVVPLDHSPPPFPSITPDAKQVSRWESFEGKVGFRAGKGSEGQERGDGAVAVAVAVAVAANAVALPTRHVEESKARQTAAGQIVEQGSEVESRDVVHETTSVGRSTLVGSSALLSPVSTNRPPQVMGQVASANVLPLPGACSAGIQGHATAHVGTAGGVDTADAAAGSQDATGDKSIDHPHAVKAHGSKREECPSDAGNEEEDPTLQEEAYQVSTSRDHESMESMSSPFASCSIGFSLLGGGEQPDNSGFAEHMGLSALELENRFMEEGITRLRARGAEGAFVVTAETGFLETSLVSTWVQAVGFRVQAEMGFLETSLVSSICVSFYGLGQD